MIDKVKMIIYESIRRAGVTNMFDIENVITLSLGQLTRDDCLEIMEHYEEYMNKYEIKRK